MSRSAPATRASRPVSLSPPAPTKGRFSGWRGKLSASAPLPTRSEKKEGNKNRISGAGPTTGKKWSCKRAEGGAGGVGEGASSTMITIRDWTSSTAMWGWGLGEGAGGETGGAYLGAYLAAAGAMTIIMAVVTVDAGDCTTIIMAAAATGDMAAMVAVATED